LLIFFICIGRYAFSFHLSKSGEFYHLHREFVETHDASDCPEDERATLCKECYFMINDSGKASKFSIAAGMDYGVS
jgi:hypothetical protein